MTGLAGCAPCTRCGACGWRIEEHSEVSSTNDLVKRAIEQGAPEGAVICARAQTGGYGRQGRTWASPEGGLYMSLLLRPQVPPQQLPTLSLVAGLAVQRALAQLTASPAIRVKWPNDVVLDRPAAGAAFQKLCGISLEQHAGAVCIGIGVNVERPLRAGAVGGKNAAAYASDIAGQPVGIADVRDAILRELTELYPAWRDQGFGPLVGKYDAVAILAGRQVTMERMDGSIIARGRALRVDDLGRLVVAAEGGEVPVSSGEAHVSA